MEGGGCLGTTSPEWVFGTMFIAGLALCAAATLTHLLWIRPRLEPVGRTQTALIACVLGGQTIFFWWSRFDLDGVSGLLKAIATSVAVLLGIAPVLLLKRAETNAFRRGRDLEGLWSRARTGARVLAAALTVACGGVAGLMFTIQVLSLRPC